MDIIYGLLMIIGFCFLAALGLPIPFAFLVPMLIGFIFVGGLPALGTAASQAISVTDSFIMLALPMFMLMGELVSRSGVATDAFDTMELWLKRIPGGLIISNIFGCAILASCTGSSVATALIMAKASLPRLVPRGYDKRLLAGVLGGTSIGLIIPPSSGFIIYGLLTDASIGRLFMAGLSVGSFMVALFTVFIIIRVALNPSLAPPITEDVTWAKRIQALKYFWPFPLIIGGVLGSIYGGVATPVEASVLGVVAVIVVSLVRGTLTWQIMKESFLGTARAASWLLLILYVGLTFGNLITYLGVTSSLDNLLKMTQMSPIVIVLGMCFLVIVLGCFLEGATIMILTMPIFAPIVQSLGFDLIWFGVMIMITMEIGLITPPVGLTCYILASVMEPYGITLEQIFKANLVYVLLMTLTIVILYFFPDLALWLPNRMIN
ncbi:MAG: TRAP transporter large permease [Deltaproteobacteria bacterium]|nr:TRAP transporter large permease [Deltaproteobacteria bacterium]